MQSYSCSYPNPNGIAPILYESITSCGSGSYQSSFKSTSAPWDAARIFILYEFSFMQARYIRNNSFSVRFSSRSRRLFQEPLLINISDSYLRSGISSQARGSPSPPSLIRKGLNPLQHSSVRQSSEGQVHLQEPLYLKQVRDQQL